jgi:hypothetical protein
MVKNATVVRESRINGRTSSNITRPLEREAICGPAGESNLADRTGQSPFPAIHTSVFFELVWGPKGSSGCDAGRRTSAVVDLFVAPDSVARVRATATQKGRSPVPVCLSQLVV